MKVIVFYLFILYWFIPNIMPFPQPVVQRMDIVTEGMQNYGGKINAVETDLKKLGKSPFTEYDTE